MNNTGKNAYLQCFRFITLLVVTVYICLWNKEAILQIEPEGKLNVLCVRMRKQVS